ncbi:MAG: hypothetical protein AN482_01900 [Anabaena sp. LE011-02]|nr:MAG: hypothetical protein AN482_01900 [Anabaena sp. LE011-02]
MLFKATGLRCTLSLFFLVFLGKTWSYGVSKNDVNSQIDDYYSLFNLKQDFNKTELEQAYNNEVEKLNNNLSIGVESRLQLMALFNTAFDTLNDSHSKSEYDLEYKLHAEQLQASKLKSEEINNDFWKYADGLFNYFISPFINFNLKSKEIIGVIACLILDLLFFAAMSN